MNHIITADEFENMSPYEKGYWVYMVGARDDQPNVPESYTPFSCDVEAFLKGQQAACQDVVDVES